VRLYTGSNLMNYPFQHLIDGTAEIVGEIAILRQWTAPCQVGALATSRDGIGTARPFTDQPVAAGHFLASSLYPFAGTKLSLDLSSS